jgi:hypothetical protein
MGGDPPLIVKCKYCGKPFAECDKHPGETCAAEMLALYTHEDMYCPKRPPPCEHGLPAAGYCYDCAKGLQ